MKSCLLITYYILVLHNLLPVASRMVPQGETLSHLHILVQKLLRYNIINQIISRVSKNVLYHRSKRIKKKPAFQAVSEDFGGYMEFHPTNREI